MHKFRKEPRVLSADYLNRIIAARLKFLTYAEKNTMAHGIVFKQFTLVVGGESPTIQNRFIVL